MSGTILGIDLGTTNSVVAIVRDGAPVLLPVDGWPIVPSVVGVSPAGELIVGKAARNQWVAAPESTIRSIKRRMGTPEKVEMAGREYSPQEISAFILRRLKEAAGAELGEAVTRAVITVPAYFTEVQRQATIEAGAIAGLEVERIVNEPTAAALAYGLGRDEDRKILVYDLGGGTFDVSVVEMSGGVLDVRATAGDNHLGGDDFDEMLAEMLADELGEGVDVRSDPRAWARLLRAAEEAKIELSSEPYALVSLEYLAENEGAPVHLRREVSRAELEGLIAETLERTLALTDRALEDAELGADDIDLVLLVGGSTRIPLVAEMVEGHIGRAPHHEIDPDAVVALGAAVQAAIVAGEPIDTILVDVTPMSLGIAVAHLTFDGRVEDDRFAVLIPRNTTVPTHFSKTFSTLYPGQEAIHVQVYQGESAIASANTPLGDFHIENLRPNTPAGLTEVAIRFALDVNGILEVTAEERGTDNRVSARLKASRQRMSLEEIERSRERVAAFGDVEEGPDVLDLVDPGTAALLDRAGRVLEREELDGKTAARIAGVREAILGALGEEDRFRVEELCDELIDLLIDAEA